LVVENGGAGIEENLNVGGAANVIGITTVLNTTQSTTKDNGALVVEGGAGIEKNLKVGGTIQSGSSIIIDGTSNPGTITESHGNISIDNENIYTTGKIGIGTTNPAGSAMLDVSSSSKGFLPPRMTIAQRRTISNPVEGLIIYNTTYKKPNYYDGTLWRNFDGSLSLGIGDFYQGGVIFYLDGTGEHGLISPTSDQSSSAQWGCKGTAISGAGGTAIGTGAQNTIDIEAGCTTAGTAADICANLTLNGYNDWFLPSKDELNQMRLNSNIIFNQFGSWWSSTEDSNDRSWLLSLPTGLFWREDKDQTKNVRAIRAF